MNKILNTVFINADYQRNCPDKSQQIAFEKTLGLGETTSIAIKTVPKLLAVSILLSSRFNYMGWRSGAYLRWFITVECIMIQSLGAKGAHMSLGGNGYGHEGRRKTSWWAARSTWPR